MLTKILVVYSSVVTTLLAAFTLAGAAAARGQDRVQQVDELDVHRINVRERQATNASRAALSEAKRIRAKIGHTPACSSITTKEPRTAVWYSVDAATRTAK